MAKMKVKATEKATNAAEKVTRERLRAMRNGEKITRKAVFLRLFHQKPSKLGLKTYKSVW